ncbi:MAG: FkbM family methyltransferase [Mariprofundaceae bacterium]
MLPIYQKQHPLYDRFLPHLAGYLKNDDVVVDVGANCGDTLASMIDTNANIHFICIEPDPEFYRYLKMNAQQISKLSPTASIEFIQSLISSTEDSVGLSGSKGTRSRDNSATPDAMHQTRSLSSILSETDQRGRVRLIKSDVDGYDYDVLSSAGEWLKLEQLMLFFECMCDEMFQREGFIEFIRTLPTLGFSDFWLFDNFGNFMLHTSDLHDIEQLIDYVWRQNIDLGTRSIYYLDILATKPDDINLATDIINDYVKCAP